MTAEKPVDELNSRVNVLKRRLRPLLWLIVAAAIGYSIRGLIISWNTTAGDVRFDAASIAPLSLAFAAQLAATLLQGFAWIVLVHQLSRVRIPTRPSLVVYFDSQMARYTPGKVGLPLIRMAGAKALGVSRRAMAASVLIEVLSWVSVGGMFGLLLLILSGTAEAMGRVVGHLAPALVVLALCGVVLMISVPRQRLPGAVMRALNLDGVGPLVPWQLPLLHVVYWCLCSAHGYFLARAFGAPSGAALAGVALYVLAPVVGFLALVAPAGAGVREAVLLGLAPIVGAKIAIGIAIASRALSLGADLSIWFAARVLARRVAPSS